MGEKIQDIALAVLIVSVTILTLLGLLAIWEVFDEEVLFKSVASIGVIAFASLITVVAAKAISKQKHNQLPPNQE